MPAFKLDDIFTPAADQPKAITEISAAVRAGDRFTTLLGATGTGKTMTMAGVIQELQRPTLVLAHNKTLAAQLCNEFRTFFPDNAVEYFVSRTTTTTSPRRTSRRATSTSRRTRRSTRRSTGCATPRPPPCSRAAT